MICASCEAVLEDVPDVCYFCGYDALLLERYRLESVLSRGRSGPLFSGRDVIDDRRVVIRATPLSALADDAAVEACAREVEALGSARIPGLAPWRAHHLVGRRRNRVLYAIQDLIDGRKLSEMALRSAPGFEELLVLLDEVLAVLETMHGSPLPLLHRDLKPANLMRTEEGALVLVDWGGARDALLGAATAASASGPPRGGAWLAPEQRRGAAGPATDLYAVGLLALALSGAPPEAMRDARGELSWQGAINDPDLHALLTDLLAPEPAARPASAADVRARIAEILMAPSGVMEGLPTLQPDLTELPEAPEPTPAAARRPTWPALAAGVVGLAVAGALGALVQPALGAGVAAAALLGCAVGLRQSAGPAAALPWEADDAPSLVTGSAPEDLFEEVLAVLEGAYSELPDPALRIRDYIRARDYGALRVDLRRLTRALPHQPPGVPEALERLQTLTRLHS
jgi:hypothetical protein